MTDAGCTGGVEGPWRAKKNDEVEVLEGVEATERGSLIDHWEQQTGDGKFHVRLIAKGHGCDYD